MRTRAVLGVTAVAAASVLYCLPHHPSVRPIPLDAALHIGFFLGLAAALAPLGRRAWMLAALAVLAIALEVIQWHLGGYRYLEWNDVLANEAGVAGAALVALLRRYARSPDRRSKRP